MRKQLRPGTYNPTGYDNTFYVRDAQGNIMATYDLVITEATNDYDAALILSEQPIYGSDRIGVRNPDLTVYSSKVNPANLWTRPDEEVYLATDSILLFPLQNAPSTGSGTVIHSGNPIVHYITAQFAHAAEGVFDMRNGQNSLTIPYNSRIGFSTQNTAVALNDCGNIELYATVNHDAYQLMSDTVYNKLKLFGRNRNLINPGTVINADNKSQSAFTRVPGSENRWYFITLSEGKVWLHTIDATAGTVENANLNLDPSNSNYGRTLALVEDNTGAGTGMLYVRRYNTTTKKTELVGFAINETGVGAPVVLAEFSGKDVSGDGEIQLSPDASRLAVINKTGKSFFGFNLITGSDVRLFDVNTTHNVLSNATTVLSANYVYYQSLDFTGSGGYLYVMKQTGNSTTPVRYNISTPGSVNLSSVTGGGDIRRGTDGKMYVATNKKMYYISSPETATSANAMTSWNNAYNMTQSLPAQPVRMGIYSIPCGGTYARVMNQKQYELKDHLGNVRVTFSDLKQPQDCDLLADGYVATAMSVNNYYSFGMLQPGRNWSTENYRFGFNGKENDNEVKGTGNSVDFGARIYDSRLGRFLSLDPRLKEFPYFSPYIYAANNPIKFIDDNGEGPIEELLTKYFTTILTQGAKNEAMARIENLRNRMNGEDETYDQYFSPIEGPNISYSRNSNHVTFKANGTINYQGFTGWGFYWSRPNSKWTNRVSGIKFEKGKEGRGFAGGILGPSERGFLITAFNEQATVLYVLVDEKSFNNIVTEYYKIYKATFKEELNKSPQLKDYYNLQVEYEYVTSLWVEAKKKVNDKDDPIHDKYAKALDEYKMHQQSYEKKYKKKN